MIRASVAASRVDERVADLAAGAGDQDDGLRTARKL